ncbi:sugar O-acetyltransferase [Lactobacillus sp. ESL0679]|uniref:sugar O-acetyltransferase n=1 Tax=Lactobacillus sp. ESL0679 TaxID=2983209 RepID=UPI0023F99709|nr:sugar O-acetyltransferase [Lactobacillus sp. ESL0679]MDF7683040.1 sugar O-acetyltransferase [Lactobacillus sp. ESL0679]
MAEDFDYQQMLKGSLYQAANIKPENTSIHGKIIAQKINREKISNKEKIISLERQLFGNFGKNSYVVPPLHVDYGRHTTIGNNFYANMDCIFLDVNQIIIGNNVLVGPRVSFYTAGHPTDAQIRQTGLEFGKRIVVSDNVWIGGYAVILPGITIGENAIIAAGAVVTKNVVANTLVGGNPDHLIKHLGKKEHVFWLIEESKYFQTKNEMK